jgi:drug/metabolite transporter (DMT)-like permease
MLYKQNVLLGALFIVFSELMFASMGASVKAMAADLPNEMIVFMRNLFGLLMLSTWLLRQGMGRLRTDILHVHLMRAGFGVAAMYCFFYALAHLPLAQGLLLKMTAPLFMPLLAFLWLREKAPRLALAALPLGFVGVVLVLDPGGDFSWIAIVGLLGGLLAAVAKVTVRRLGHSEPTFRVVFYFALFATLISAIPLLWAWQTPAPNSWGLMLLMGATGTLGQLLLTRGYAIAQAAQVAPFTYFSVVFGASYGYLFWDETLDLGFIIGALCIAAAGLLAIGTEKRRPVVQRPVADLEP